MRRGRIHLSLEGKTQISIVIKENQAVFFLPNIKFSYHVDHVDCEVQILYWGITTPELFVRRDKTNNIWIPFNLNELFWLNDYNIGKSLNNKGMHILSQSIQDLSLDILVDSVLKELAKNSFGSKWMLQGYAYEIMAIIIRNLHMDSQKNFLILQGKIDELIEIAKNYMIINYRENLSIEQIAAQVYLSQGYFSRMFKEHTGISPRSFLLQIRLDKACELLEQEKAKIDSVAQTVGFESASKMNAIFKRHMSMSPMAYRVSKRKIVKKESFCTEEWLDNIFASRGKQGN